MFRSLSHQRRRRLLVSIAVVTTVGTGALPAATASAQGPAAKEPAGTFSATAAAQIAALQKVKARQSSTIKKLSSDLSVPLMAATDSSIAAALPRLGSVRGSSRDMKTVDISATVTPALLDSIRSLGGRVGYASAAAHSIRATVPLNAVGTLAAAKGVTRIRSAAQAMTSSVGPRPTPTKAEREARVKAAMERALSQAAQAGTIVSEGDVTHAANAARDRRRVTGVGVKVCALSDGVDSLAASQAAGELPAVDVLPGQAGQGDEGTAMLEIVHDLAPGASLGFATAFTSDASFAENIRALRSQARCDIIVDDVIYFNESSFQDGPIAQAVNDVTADGAMYFSSAGNEGSVLSGTSANYEGDFADSGQTVGKFVGTAHDFDPGPGVQVYEPVSYDGFLFATPAILQWANPLGAASDDYDLYLLDSEGNLVGFSQDVQDGTQDPLEILGVIGADLRLAVVKYSGQARYLQLSTLRGRYRDGAGLKAFVTPGITRGHSAAAYAFSVAAAPAAEGIGEIQPGDPTGPSGPFPGVFTTSQQPEVFSSDGPRRMFFAADGSPAPQTRQKPDITAADGVRTSLADFDPFFGTSAAAPHAAAIAALVKSGNPRADTAFVRTAFRATALDLAPRGVDPRTGYGLLRADRVLAYTGATPQPWVVIGQASIVSTSDGDAILEPGESAQLTVPVTNSGDFLATGVSVTLTPSVAGASVTPRSRTIGKVPVGQSRSATFTLTIPPTWELGRPVELSARVTFVGTLSPTTGVLSVPVGVLAPEVVFRYAGPALPIPDDDIAGASVTIPVSGVGRAGALAVSVDGTECTTAEGATTVGIDHTWVGDLTATVTAPDGTTAVVFSGSGGSGNNLCQVRFADGAGRAFSTATSADAPFTGSWAPESVLSSTLTGVANGDWTVTVVDGAGGDSGTLRSVSLGLRSWVTG